MTKTIGVMGGLGPAATLDFFGKIISRTKASREQDHLRLIIDNNPKVADRNAALDNKGPSPGPALAAMARGLEAAGADVVVMACNAAHAWENEIRDGLSVPFLSMIGETADEAAKLGVRRAGLLSVDAALKASLYQDALKARGIEPVVLEAMSQAAFMQLVYRIKSGDVGGEVRAQMRGLAQRLLDAGANAVIAGCTEVPLTLDQKDLSAPLVSSTDVLVERVIRFAGAELKD